MSSDESSSGSNNSSDYESEDSQPIRPTLHTGLTYQLGNMTDRVTSPTPSISGRQPRAVPAPAQVSEVTTIRTLKIPMPDTFDGTRAKLKAFKTQVGLYIQFNSAYFQNDMDKIMFMITFFRGPAFDWVDPHYTEYRERPPTSRNVATRALFESFATFQEKLTMVFGNIDEKRNAEREIQNLRQRASATEYLAKFQRLATRTEWDTDALLAQFYRGLKDSVKDEIAKIDRPTDLEAMYTLAVRIDTRQYERQLEKKGSYVPFHSKKSQKTREHYGPQPMEIDATRGRPLFNKPQKGFVKNKGNKGDKTCYGCGRKGHFLRDCRSRKQNLPRTGPPRQIAATEARDHHNSLTWTACYDDSCRTHLSDKQGSGWFPSKPRNSQTFAATRINAGQQQGASWERTLQYLDDSDGSDGVSVGENPDGPIPAESPPTGRSERNRILNGNHLTGLKSTGLESAGEESAGEESAEDSSENESTDPNNSSDDSEPGIHDRYAQLIIRHPTPSLREQSQQERLREAYDTAFCILHARQDVARYWLQEVERSIRNAIEGGPLTETVSLSYRDIIQEKVPPGSLFTKQGGYITPDNGYIPRELRLRVKTIQEEYKKRDPKVNPHARVDPQDFQYYQAPAILRRIAQEPKN